MARCGLLGGLAWCLAWPVLTLAGPPVTLDSLLKEMTDRDRLARFPDPPYTCKQASSYDRKSTEPEKADTWFANDDYSQYLRTETTDGRTEWVMMDTAGPGAVVRIWSANPPVGGILRVYLDGASKPAIEAPMTDVLNGKWKAPEPLSYVASKGWNLYLPIPYAKHCKITCDKDKFYYQINYRTYEKGTAVESLSATALDSAAGSIKSVAEEMLKSRTSGMPTFAADERPLAESKKVGPGEKLTLALPTGGSALTGMMLSLRAADQAQALRSCILEGTFDGEPTVWCPAGDFFGTGVSINEYQDWYRAVGKDGVMRSRWVMPCQKSGQIAVHNLGKEPVEVDLKARVKPWAWDDRSMHFHTVWRMEYPVHAYGARGSSDFNYVDINGKGVYVGDVLSIMNPVKEWWGEGDEKIYVDGEKFPSHFGTGTEDYYGYAWCWPDPFHRPFHAQPRCDGGLLTNKNNWGRTTVTRSRALDAIPFTTALSMNMEVWHWKECDVEYASTAYFYARPGATTNRPPVPEAAARKVIEAPPLPPPLKVKDGIECEKLEVVSKTEGIPVGKQGGFGPELWSEEHQLWVQGTKPGDFVELRVPAPAGKSKVMVYATRSWDYGIVRFSVNGTKAGEDVDLYSGGREVKATGPIDLGVHEAKGGALVLRCEVVGGNAKSEGSKSFFGLDCVVLEPVK